MCFTLTNPTLPERIVPGLHRGHVSDGVGTVVERSHTPSSLAAAAVRRSWHLEVSTGVFTALGQLEYQPLDLQEPEASPCASLCIIGTPSALQCRSAQAAAVTRSTLHGPCPCLCVLFALKRCRVSP